MHNGNAIGPNIFLLPLGFVQIFLHSSKTFENKPIKSASQKAPFSQKLIRDFVHLTSLCSRSIRGCLTQIIFPIRSPLRLRERCMARVKRQIVKLNSSSISYMKIKGRFSALASLVVQFGKQPELDHVRASSGAELPLNGSVITLELLCQGSTNEPGTEAK
jgi:hypothetical protein